MEVIEAWSLKNGKIKGRHVITLTNQVLVDEVYESPKLPFIFYNWIDPVVNFWGTGVVEQLEAMQVEINKTLYRIQRALELFGVPWVLVEKNSEIVKDSMSNRTGQVIRYSKTKPDVSTHKSINSESLQYLEFLYRKAFEIAGISQQSAVGRKDPGITAGVAMREQQDIESERFMKSMKDYEDAFLNIAFHIIQAVKEIARDEGSYKIKIHGDKVVEEITWEDINLEDHQYKIQIFPVSSLPTRPEGKLQVVQEYLHAGFIDADTARDQFNFPDMEKEEEIHLAYREVIKKAVDTMLVEGEYQSLDPLDNLEYALQYSTGAYHLARVEGIDEEKIN